MSVEAPASARVERESIAAYPGTQARRIAVARVDVLIIILIFVFAMVPRVAWAAYTDRPPQGLNDPSLYVLLGDIMANGDGYSRPTGEPFAYYPVGFPATVAGLKKAGDILGWDRSIMSIKLMNATFGALTVVLVYGIAARLFDRRVGVASAGLLAVFPSQVYYSGSILSEPLFTLLFMAALLALLWDPWKREGLPWPRLAAAGLLLGAATMTRGITLVFPLLLLAFWLFTLDSKRRALQHALLLFAGIAVFTVPWAVRNSVQFNTIVGPSTNLGDDACIGNFDGATGAFLLHGKCFEGYEGLAPQDVEVHRNRDGLRIAVEDVVTDPFRMPGLVAKKAYWLLYKDDDGLFAIESYGNDYFIGNYRREVLAFAANAVYYATGFIVLAGAAAFALSKDLRRAFVLAAMVYLLAVPLAFFGDPRFHFPAIPLAVIIAAATAIMIWDRHRFRRLPGIEAIR